MTKHQPQRGVEADRTTGGGFLGAIVGFYGGVVVGLVGGGIIASSWVDGGIAGRGYLLLSMVAVVISAFVGGLIGAPVGLIIGAEVGFVIASMLDWHEIRAKNAEVRVLLKRAKTELYERNWDEAVIILTEVIRLNPALIEAYHRRTIAYLALNELEGAIADCNRVIITDRTPITRSEPVPPYVADAYAHRGSAFARMGQHGKAIADFTEAIQLTPDVPTPYEWRAQSRRTIGDTKGAAEDELKAHDLASPLQ
jgi:tetratricopeptide (TPR) repeat protein